MENELVVKHNDLVEARYNLNLTEQKIILYSVSKIDTAKDKFNLIQLEVKEITKLIGTDKDRYSEFSSIANGLMDKKIYFKDRPNLDIRWLASSEYVGDGIIELEFSEKLIPYLLKLKEKFTRYQLKNIINFKNKHSLRIYELMKQYQSIGKRNFELEEFKQILFLENQYERIYDFRRFVLDSAKEEINKDTDINISYETIKKGRKIVGLSFKIESKDQEREVYIDYLNEFYNIKEMKFKMGLKEESFSTEQVMSVYEKAIEKAGNEDIDLFEYVRLNYNYIKSKARNKYSYLLKALENDYASAIGQISLDYYIES
ncbi:replication initiation protein [Senegalia sp. (in: firmicutes)]|uniref:replication initiation protein n=1 Tax=Senegalia sp. (in: firmicutes) TaxID=1924098 RepID=UPI003F998486